MNSSSSLVLQLSTNAIFRQNFLSQTFSYPGEPVMIHRRALSKSMKMALGQSQFLDI